MCTLLYKIAPHPLVKNSERKIIISTKKIKSWTNFPFKKMHSAIKWSGAIYDFQGFLRPQWTRQIHKKAPIPKKS